MFSESDPSWDQVSSVLESAAEAVLAFDFPLDVGLDDVEEVRPEFEDSDLVNLGKVLEAREDSAGIQEYDISVVEFEDPRMALMIDRAFQGFGDAVEALAEAVKGLGKVVHVSNLIDTQVLGEIAQELELFGRGAAFTGFIELPHEFQPFIFALNPLDFSGVLFFPHGGEAVFEGGGTDAGTGLFVPAGPFVVDDLSLGDPGNGSFFEGSVPSDGEGVIDLGVFQGVGHVFDYGSCGVRVSKGFYFPRIFEIWSETMISRPSTVAKGRTG